ncbi:hypothetical protein C8R43DRAFT_963839 [Mycena crocata]|nr:hypothetical protein C8R43DRAFT_963839 [Mycena crocata]
MGAWRKNQKMSLCTEGSESVRDIHRKMGAWRKNQKMSLCTEGSVRDQRPNETYTPRNRNQCETYTERWVLGERIRKCRCAPKDQCLTKHEVTGTHQGIRVSPKKKRFLCVHREISARPTPQNGCLEKESKMSLCTEGSVRDQARGHRHAPRNRNQCETYTEKWVLGERIKKCRCALKDQCEAKDRVRRTHRGIGVSLKKIILARHTPKNGCLEKELENVAVHRRISACHKHEVTGTDQGIVRDLHRKMGAWRKNQKMSLCTEGSVRGQRPSETYTPRNRRVAKKKLKDFFVCTN